MKSNYKKLAVLLLVLLPMFISGLALAESKTIWEKELKDVSRFKLFSIKYEEQIGEDELLGDYIYVLDENGEKLKDNLRRLPFDEKVVSIEDPLRGYDFGKSYILVIRRKNGNSEEVHKTKFTIEKRPENVVIPLKDTPKEAFEFEKLEDGIHIKRYDESYGTTVKIPNQIDGMDVTVIGNYAFFEKRLETVIFPSKLKSIGDSSFGYNNLQRVEFPDILESIGEGAFERNLISEVKYNDELKQICKSAFSVNELTEFYSPKKLEFLGQCAYFNNHIKEITISPKLSVIEAMTFENNELTLVEIPEGIKKIESSAFKNNKISNLKLSESLESILSGAFADNNLSDIKLPSNLKMIYTESFKNNNIKSIKLPERLEFIGDRAFENNEIQNINIPSSVMGCGEQILSQNNTKKVHISNPATTYYPNSFDETTVVEVEPRIKLPVAELFNSSDAKKLAMQKFGYPYQTDYYFIDGTGTISEKDGAFANVGNHEAMEQLYTVYGAETDFIASEFSGYIEYIRNEDGTYKATKLSFSKPGFFGIEGYDIGSKISSDKLETLKAKYKSELGLNLEIGLNNDDQATIKYVELSK